VIQFENVGLRYGLGPEILRDLSFKITPHSFQFLSGPSGAGKTHCCGCCSLRCGQRAA
jgi:cell division transport system ATP-binding protein